jgi:hypothetical protein
LAPRSVSCGPTETAEEVEGFIIGSAMPEFIEIIESRGPNSLWAVPDVGL